MTRLLLVLASLTLTACTSFPTPHYVSDTDNVLALRAYRNNKVVLGDFKSSAPQLSELMCRGAGPIKPAGGLTFAEYVKQSFAQELTAAEMLSPQGAITLSADLTTVELAGMTSQWRLAMTLRSSNGRTLSVSTESESKFMFDGMAGCRMAANQLVPAVRKLISTTVASPAFAELLR
ncbi:MAG: hypothetical protein EOP39_04065 [Rubrivivax sp.]|nr:MAG: hypothetical protein EOP39_04065 [Rubrivivax sp.]